MKDKTTTCSRCLLDTSDTKIIDFDEQGVCNYCRSYDSKVEKLGSLSQRKAWLENKVGEIKIAGKNKKYDCILGLSGGLDSSYMAVWAHEVGLRPLLVHMDNGWNNELAVQNINLICKAFNFDLHTVVLDWSEFKELQKAYLRASVVDIEVLTDHAIAATIYKLAVKNKIRYTLNGFNLATEAIMPKGWTYDKLDFQNIKDIAFKYGNISKYKTYPHIEFWRKLYYHFFLKLESIHVLNYIEFDTTRAKKELIDKLGWKDYGGKHFESMFTKFYQAFILPTKFGIDKRKAHLSNLICSSGMNKEDALKKIQTSNYIDEELEHDKTFVLKKLGLSNEEFEKIMELPVQQHQDFKTEDSLWDNYFKFIRFAKKLKKA